MTKFIKTAAILAFLLGFFSVISGSLVITGFKDPGYFILPWLVYYNIIAGFISLYAAYLIWSVKKPVLQLSAFIASAHILVLLSLNTIFFDVVAQESISAMIMRSFIWIVILYIVKKTQKSVQSFK